MQKTLIILGILATLLIITNAVTERSTKIAKQTETSTNTNETQPIKATGRITVQ